MKPGGSSDGPDHRGMDQPLKHMQHRIILWYSFFIHRSIVMV